MSRRDNMAEAGVPDFVVTSWAAFVVPKATPRPIVDKVAAALHEISADPALQARFEVAGARSLGSAPEDVTAMALKERPMWHASRARDSTEWPPHRRAEGGAPCRSDHPLR